METINAGLLVSTAHDILIEDLRSHSNVLSQPHRDALRRVLECFASYVTGHASGRKAIGLATGLGKTSSIVAFVVALERLGYEVPVAISASRVEALSDLKRELLAKGVPEEKIGLKHSQRVTDTRLLLPSTGDDSRVYQCVTHARVRSGRDLKLFSTYRGQDRALMLYDETLLRSDTLAVDKTQLKGAVASMGAIIEDHEGIVQRLAHAHLAECFTAVEQAIAALRIEGDAEGRGRFVTLPAKDDGELEAYVEAIATVRLPLAYAETLRDMLVISKDSARVLLTTDGSGLVWSSEAVPPQLRNVVVLDASTSIRQLVNFDPTIETLADFDCIKSFSQVDVFQLLAGGGRSTIEKSYGGIGREKSAVSHEVVDIIKETWKNSTGYLLVTYKKHSIDIAGTLLRDLHQEGIDVDALTPSGNPMVSLLQWGNETSSNRYAHCSHVILAGCIQRSHLEIAAAIQGQTLDRATPLPHKLINGVLESEIGHCIYQAASRGSCRRVIDGQALPMALYFIHRSVGMEGLLRKVMPDVRWHYRPTAHLTAGRIEGRVAATAAALLAYLRTLPEHVCRVSNRELKRALAIGADSASKAAFTRARTVATETSNSGWTTEQRGLVRWGSAFMEAS